MQLSPCTPSFPPVALSPLPLQFVGSAIQTVAELLEFVRVNFPNLPSERLLRGQGRRDGALPGGSLRGSLVLQTQHLLVSC